MPLAPLIASFLFVSAVSHFALTLPGVNGWYNRNLERGVNWARWWEYSLSSSIMIVVIALFPGIYDLGSIILIFSLNVMMITPRMAGVDAVDFWRVEAHEEDRLLRLSAEMKLPGRAWLQFEVGGDGPETTIHQTAIFDPVGLLGLIYWYAHYPVHALIFAGMLRGIAREAQRGNSPGAAQAASRHRTSGA